MPPEGSKTPTGKGTLSLRLPPSSCCTAPWLAHQLPGSNPPFLCPSPFYSCSPFVLLRSHHQSYFCRASRRYKYPSIRFPPSCCCPTPRHTIVHISRRRKPQLAGLQVAECKHCRLCHSHACPASSIPTDPVFLVTEHHRAESRLVKPLPSARLTGQPTSQPANQPTSHSAFSSSSLSKSVIQDLATTASTPTPELCPGSGPP